MNRYHEIKTTGEGVLYVKPDKVTVTLGVVTAGIDIQTIQSENSSKMNSIIQALLQLGIPRDNISTTEYSINHTYDYQDGKTIPTGFEVRNLIELTIDDVQQTGVIIDTAVNYGANYFSDLLYSLTNQNQNVYYQQALSLAALNAKQKAGSMAKSMGLLIDPVPIKLSEIVVSPGHPYALAESVSVTGVATPIEPGESMIKAQVEGIFAITY